MKKKIGIICIILGLAIPIIAFSFAHHDPSADLLKDMCEMRIVLYEDKQASTDSIKEIFIPYCFIAAGGIILMGIGAGLLEVKKKIYMKIDKINATGGPMFDRIFKIALIILGVLFLILYSNNQNGRYQSIIQNQASQQILDTRTGLMYGYIINNGLLTWVIIDPVKGTLQSKDRLQ